MAIFNMSPHLLGELDRLANTSSESDQQLARSALMWLSVAQVPLRAHELWLFLQVEATKESSSAHVETLITSPSHASDQEARDHLRRLLGNLVTFHQGPDQTMTAHLAPQNGTASPATIRFTRQQAHILAASVCMTIVSLSTFPLAHLHRAHTPSDLRLYAWRFWSVHLRRSNSGFANPNIEALADSMIRRVGVDASLFLLNMCDVMTKGDVRIPSGRGWVGGTAAVRTGMLALERAIGAADILVVGERWAERLSAARDGVLKSGFEIEESWFLREDGSLVESSSDESEDANEEISVEVEPQPWWKQRSYRLETLKTVQAHAQATAIEILRLDTLLKRTLPTMSHADSETILALTNLSRTLRLLAVLFTKQPLKHHLASQFMCWSFPDILFHLSNWAEELAGYPFWDILPEDWTHTDYNAHGRADVNSESALLLLREVRRYEPSFRFGKCYIRRLPKEVPPPGISWVRWHAALTVEAVRHCLRFVLPRDVALDNIGSSSTSFSRVPPHMYDSRAHLLSLISILPCPVRTFVLQSIKTRLLPPAAFSVAEKNHDKAKTSLLRRGYRKAMALCLVAILINHIKRMLIPWLGAYMYHTPLADLKMAIGSPAVFLDESLSFSWRYVMSMTLQQYIVDFLVGSVSFWILNRDADADTSDNNEDGKTPSIQKAPSEPVVEAAQVTYLLWLLCSAEYIFTRTLNATAHAIAYTRLLEGSEAHKTALVHVLVRHLSQLPLHFWQLGFYTTKGLIPLTYNSLFSALVCGEPGLLCAILFLSGLAWVVTRWSSKFYILLELTGLWLVLAYCLLAGIVLGREFIRDPFGLGKESARLSRMAGRVERLFPRETRERIFVLREKCECEERNRAVSEGLRI